MPTLAERALAAAGAVALAAAARRKPNRDARVTVIVEALVGTIYP
jgi:hypothetical protein